MNYRHAFHAGSFSDVVKHALLTRLIVYLRRKDKPFRVYDTHAGPAGYALDGPEAVRTGEADTGVRLLAASETARADPLLAPYVSAIAGDLAANRYPGSPVLIRRLLRDGDRLSAYELHPDDAETLKAAMAGDVAVKAIALDAWLALGSHLPPKEKRGLVFVDPAFEAPDEVDRIVEAFGKAFRRWPNGVYALWYPLKHRARMEAMLSRLAAIAPGECLAAEFLRAPYGDDVELVGTGLFVVNAPYVFADEAETMLSTLAPVLGRGGEATWRVFKPQA